MSAIAEHDPGDAGLHRRGEHAASGVMIFHRAFNILLNQVGLMAIAAADPASAEVIT